MLGPVLAEAFKLDECRQHYLAGPLQEQPGLRRDLLVGAGDSRGYLGPCPEHDNRMPRSRDLT